MSWALCFKKNSVLLGTVILLVALSAGVLDTESVGTVGLATPPLSGGYSPTKQVIELLSGYLEKRGACAGSPSAEFLAPIPGHGLSLQSPPPTDAALRVVSCRWDPMRKELQFYLHCSEPDICRPFLATLRTDNSLWPSTHMANEPLSARRALHSSASSTATGEVPLVRIGEAARLDLTGQGVHIRLQVTCLERGVLGQQVRVRVLGSSKILLASVRGPQLLTAELP